MPEVSVIIPTYNRAKYVTKAIDSVLAQTYRDYEIIVVDDGSTDNTSEVLNPYMDRIHYIYQENAGVSAARNRGIMDAKGEWIAFLDSDDEWLPEKLSIQMRDVQRRPDVCAHITNVTFNPLNGRAISLFEVRNFKGYGVSSFILERPFQYMLKYEIAVLPTLLVRRDILLDSGLFDTELSIAEDVDIFLRVALEGPWAGSNIELLNCYRRKETLPSLTRQFRSDEHLRCKNIVYILAKLKDDPRLNEQERCLLNQVLSRWIFRLGTQQRKKRDKTNARQSYNKALALNPSIKTLVKYVVTLLPSRASLWLFEKWHLRHGMGFRI
jgi:glycosyltransferase involved in cell wall biosynthesis